MCILAHEAQTTTKTKIKAEIQEEIASRNQEIDEKLIEEMEIEKNWRGKVVKARKKLKRQGKF